MNAEAHSLLDSRTAPRSRKRLTISGTVQGVGFRPFLYRRALAHGLSGFAMNGPEGVIAEVEGSANAITAFIEDICETSPVNAVVRDVTAFDHVLHVDKGLIIFWVDTVVKLSLIEDVYHNCLRDGYRPN